MLTLILSGPPSCGDEPKSAPGTGPPARPRSVDRKPKDDALTPAGEMKQCLLLIRSKRYDDARARLKPLIAAHPRWARAKFMLALTYHEEQRYELARPLFEDALSLDAREHAARPFYGWCLYYLGEPESAREQFEAYLKINPSYADAHFAIGLIDFDQDHLDESTQRFMKTITLAQAAKDPRTEGKARARLGDVYLRLNHLDDARDELLKAVELRPDAYEAYFKLSRVYQRLGNLEKARWAREMHEKIRDKLHPTTPPMGGQNSQPAGKAP